MGGERIGGGVGGKLGGKVVGGGRVRRVRREGL